MAPHPRNLSDYSEGQEWQQEEDHDAARDEAFDTALHLASHAQRLKNLESSIEQFTHHLHDLRLRDSQGRTRQNVLMGLLAAAMVATALFSAFWPRLQEIQTGAPQRPVQQAQARSASPAPAPAVQIQPPAAAPQQALIRPSVIPGQAAYAPPPAPVAVTPVSQFQAGVQSRLAAKGETVPAGWQAFFDRDAAGDGKGKLLVAAKFLRGEDVTRDQSFAVELIRQAANSGEKEAMLWLAYAYQGGHLGRVDRQSAARWFEMAGKTGVTQAYTELGRMYEAGIDGAPDTEAALAWYQQAAKGGDVKAAEAISRINNKSAPQQEGSIFQPANTGGMIQPVQPQQKGQRQKLGAQAQNSPGWPDADSPYPENAAPLSPSVSATPVAASVPVPSTLVGMSPEDASNEIRAVQRGLKALGYKIERIDGAYGPTTANAIRTYQRAKNIFPDGEPSPELIEAIMKDVRYGN